MQSGVGRSYNREEMVFRVTVRVGTMAYYGVIVDLSIVGIKMQVEDEIAVGTACRVEIPDLKFSAESTVVRFERTVSGHALALKFNEEQHSIPGKMLEYKVRQRLSPRK